MVKAVRLSQVHNTGTQGRFKKRSNRHLRPHNPDRTKRKLFEIYSNTQHKNIILSVSAATHNNFSSVAHEQKTIKFLGKGWKVSAEGENWTVTRQNPSQALLFSWLCRKPYRLFEKVGYELFRKVSFSTAWDLLPAGRHLQPIYL